MVWLSCRKASSFGKTGQAASGLFGCSRGTPYSTCDVDVPPGLDGSFQVAWAQIGTQGRHGHEELTESQGHWEQGGE